MSENELLQSILSELKGLREDIKNLDAKVDRKFTDTNKTVYEVSEVITNIVSDSTANLQEAMKEVKAVTATNCYDIANLRQQIDTPKQK